jgi:replication factor C subunit 3/5
MDSDDDVQMLEDDEPRFSFAQKGKGKAAETETTDVAPDNLPWCVSCATPILVVELYNRVEKYRPVTLDDVVSHKDITATSENFVITSRFA